ncbi:DUF3311 domain-containing protein [Sphingomonas sanxanigenens]|uniref:DUF3311 domain-containing protein n=1 Tax=Sphingomonas sanxanigenens DSM 19645 = NX02 TaxID=1123269 RepID=W0AFJ9_9SPHN|nr:DUF3311 domain-containing protein [Sphingomonas sanxanigenens]AHE55317.1 hypothetical protein NX02_18240 [Sphingomonas sanxanigenens DSM 19645 = NX02]
MTEPTDDADVVQRLRRADLLLLLPFAWQLGLAPWANGVSWSPLGLPFGMVWQMAGILFATVVLGFRFALDTSGPAK